MMASLIDDLDLEGGDPLAASLKTHAPAQYTQAQLDS
jgi:hypothetical protein